MDDRFRFRAYYYNDVFNKWIVYENPEFITGDGTCRVFDNSESGADEWRENVILCQCTGLKDKNGKLIYEGDVVKDRLKQILKVSYENSKACFVLENSKYIGYICELKYTMQTVEVIGNIYENKELLESEG